MLLSARTTIGTQEAAEFLEVSRPYLIRLLGKGEIPFSSVKTRRRIRMSDLVAYQNKIRRTRKKQLNFLTGQAQELKMGYSDFQLGDNNKAFLITRK